MARTPDSLRPCKVCFKLYDPSVPHQVLSHTHQGQGPDDKTTKRDRE